MERRSDGFVFHSPHGEPLVVRPSCSSSASTTFAVSVQLGHEDGGALVMSRYGHPSKDAARARLLRPFSVGAPETGSSAGSTRRIAKRPYGLPLRSAAFFSGPHRFRGKSEAATEPHPSGNKAVAELVAEPAGTMGM
jgi:hypothetical protein